jgi:hypothetical protein
LVRLGALARIRDERVLSRSHSRICVSTSVHDVSPLRSPYLAEFVSSAIKAEDKSSRGKSSVGYGLRHLGGRGLEGNQQMAIILL